MKKITFLYLHMRKSHKGHNTHVIIGKVYQFFVTFHPPNIDTIIIVIILLDLVQDSCITNPTSNNASDLDQFTLNYKIEMCNQYNSVK